MFSSDYAALTVNSEYHIETIMSAGVRRALVVWGAWRESPSARDQESGVDTGILTGIDHKGWWDVGEVVGVGVGVSRKMCRV